MLAERAAAGEFRFVSFEKLVPGPAWGFTNEGRPDCFHFDRHGHELLGAAIDAYVAGL